MVRIGKKEQMCGKQSIQLRLFSILPAGFAISLASSSFSPLMSIIRSMFLSPSIFHLALSSTIIHSPINSANSPIGVYESGFRSCGGQRRRGATHSRRSAFAGSSSPAASGVFRTNMDCRLHRAPHATIRSKTQRACSRCSRRRAKSTCRRTSETKTLLEAKSIIRTIDDTNTIIYSAYSLRNQSFALARRLRPSFLPYKRSILHFFLLYLNSF